MTATQTWAEKSTKEIMGDKDSPNFELAIIAGCLQRIANRDDNLEKYLKARQEIERLENEWRELYAENHELRKALAKRKWYQVWK